jgi:hypothetical protein
LKAWAGQRAIAAAEAWVMAEAQGKTLKQGQKGVNHPELLFVIKR